MRTLGNGVVGKTLDRIGFGHRKLHVAPSTRSVGDGCDSDSTERRSTSVVLGQFSSRQRVGGHFSLGANLSERLVGARLGFFGPLPSRLGGVARSSQGCVDAGQFLVGRRRGLQQLESAIVELVTTGGQRL